MNKSTKYILIILIFISSITIFANSKRYILNMKNNIISITPSALKININDMEIASAKQNEIVSNLKYNKNKISFIRNNYKIVIEKMDNYVLFQFKPLNYGKITFPIIKTAKKMLLPFGEGLYLPTQNKAISKYMENSGSFQGTNFSLQLFGATYKKNNILFIINNIFNNNFNFEDENGSLAFYFTHTTGKVAGLVPFSYRMYIIKNNFINITAKIYKKYKIKHNEFKTLKEKSEISPNVKKLYGAPFIYVWGDELCARSDVNWHLLQAKIKVELKSKNINPIKYLSNMLGKKNILIQLSNQNYVDNYNKSVFDYYLKKLVKMPALYNDKIFKNIKLNKIANFYLSKGIKNLNKLQLIQFNSNVIQSIFNKSMLPVNKWGNGVSLWLLNQLKEGGITRAWIGLDNATLSYYHPNFIKQAVKDGYLIAPYDSYHSIESGNITIPTAVFHNKKLYNSGSMKNKNGEFYTGFLKRGRDLNPKFALSPLKYRTNKYFKVGIKFNSWFVDSEGAGDILTDYSTVHPTSQKQNVAARRKLFMYLTNRYKLVVGTEGGNDYLSKVIDYGQGIASPYIWNFNMARNKKSKYYTGSYYAPYGIPSIYIKPVPLIPIIKTIYFNPNYKVPLFQLVYNNSIIVAPHWQFANFKFPQVINQRLAETILFDEAPLFHLDKIQWNKNKKIIIKFYKIWSPLAKKLQQVNMVSFNFLNNNKFLQETKFSNGTKIIANFGPTVHYNHKLLRKYSVLVIKKNKINIYNF